jgi:hypothetical protein
MKMKRVFVSYRHEQPDEALAKYLADHLKDDGYNVFIDVDLNVGQEWGAEIESALLGCDFLIVLLTKHSIASNMVRHEVSLAHKNGKYILPILIDFTHESLPYDLGSYLHRLQGLNWTSQKSNEELAARISEALLQARAPGITQAPDIDYHDGAELRRITEATGAPLPSADPRLVATLESGTLELESSFYIRRDTDATAEQYLEAAAPTLIIRAPHQMGKSSLLARLHAQAQQMGRKSFYLDFQLVDNAHLSDMDRLFRYLARQFQRALGSSIDPRKVWDDLDGPKGNINHYLEDAVLASATVPVHLMFDEVERLFEVPYRDEFFSTLRGWHNLRATNLRFRKLCTAIGHATTPTYWITDINQSPFNVGQTLVLRGFNEEQVAELNVKYGSPLRDEMEIKEIIDLLDGHAYLTRLALYKLAVREHTFADLVRSLDVQGGPFSEHLLGVSLTLNKAPDLRDSLYDILLGHGCDDEMHYQRLWAFGLIHGRTRGEATFSCRLYEEYFRHHL